MRMRMWMWLSWGWAQGQRDRDGAGAACAACVAIEGVVPEPLDNCSAAARSRADEPGDSSQLLQRSGRKGKKGREEKHNYRGLGGGTAHGCNFQAQPRSQRVTLPLIFKRALFHLCLLSFNPWTPGQAPESPQCSLSIPATSSAQPSVGTTTPPVCLETPMFPPLPSHSPTFPSQSCSRLRNRSPVY